MLEISLEKTSQRNIKYGKCPTNIKMIEEVWLKTGGATVQFHPTKLTIAHLDKNAHSRMNVSLAIQLLSSSVAALIQEVIKEDKIVLSKQSCVQLLGRSL